MDRLLIFIMIALCTKVIGSGTHKKRPLTTIQSSDGDIIDCFRIMDQPAFDHPLLRNHKIQEARLPKTGEKRKVWQVWNQNGSSCPDGTVPIRRSHVGAKPMKKKQWRETPAYTADQGHEYAIGYMVDRGGIYGTRAITNVWGPTVQQGTDEFSLGQIWLVAGHYDQPDLNTIEAGWQVFPEHYLDNQPRFFVYWTSDTYHSTGCLNLECEGFVQVSPDFAVGAALSPISSYGGGQYELDIIICKDTDDGNWWLGVGQSLIGYWPSKLFTHLADGPAMLVQWGGEVVNQRTYGQHTTTQMGSGHFPAEGFGKASFFRKLNVIDSLYHLQPAEEFVLKTTNSTCYNVVKVHTEEWGTHFYYGGPGFNPLCL